MKTHRFINIAKGLIYILFLALVSPQASSGIPEPPILMYGSLENVQGMEITSGQLRFTFAPVAGGQTVTADAVVGALASNINFIAEIPVESFGVSKVDSVLERLAVYTPQVRYAGSVIANASLPSPFTADRALLFGPIRYVVDPAGPMLSISRAIDFAPILLGSHADASFTVANPGKAAITGTGSLKSRHQVPLPPQYHFQLVDGNGDELSEVPITLNPGQSMEVTVRFLPALISSYLTDIFQVVTTNAGTQERDVTGVCKPAEPEDLNQDGDINMLDLWEMAKYWYLPGDDLPANRKGCDLDGSGEVNREDLMILLERYR